MKNNYSEKEVNKAIRRRRRNNQTNANNATNNNQPTIKYISAPYIKSRNMTSSSAASRRGPSRTRSAMWRTPFQPTKPQTWSTSYHAKTATRYTYRRDGKKPENKEEGTSRSNSSPRRQFTSVPTHNTITWRTHNSLEQCFYNTYKQKLKTTKVYRSSLQYIQQQLLQ